MANRREVLQLGVVVSMAAFLPQHTLAMVRTQDTPVTLFKILVDTRFQDSLTLSNDMLVTFQQDTPALLESISGNVAPFWHHQLSRQWAGDSTALAGVTGERVLFCLQQFAREKQMRVAWQKLHAETIMDPVTGQSEQLVSWVIH